MPYVFVCLQETELAQKVANAFSQPLHRASFDQFADGEVAVALPDPSIYANQQVVILQSAQHPVNAYMFGIAFLAHALKNAGARKIIAVIPYLGYARQERSAITGKPGVAAVVAKMLESAGIDLLITVQVHDEKIIDFFSIPVHNLAVQSIMIDRLKEHQNGDALCLVAPDQGAASWVQTIASKIGANIIVFSKKRIGIDRTQVTDQDGECDGANAIILDDIIATGGTAINAATRLAQRGTASIDGYFVHPVFAGNALAQIKESEIKTIWVSNTLPLPQAAQGWIKQFDVSDLIIDALKKIKV